MSFRASVLGGKEYGSDGPEGIDFELHDFEKDSKQKGKNIQKSANKGSFRQRENGSNKQIEMKNFNNINHYVIDDNSDEEEEQNSPEPVTTKQTEGTPNKLSGNRPAREVVFDEF